MKNKKQETPEERADRYATDFIIKHTNLEVDGMEHRVLVKLFIAHEREIRAATIDNISKMSAYENI